MAGKPVNQLSINVLLVEDNPTDARLLERLLERVNGVVFTLSRASSLEAAIALVVDFQFDVMLLDLGLPDSQGLKTLRLMRDHNRELPIVVLTGLDDERMGIESLREGAQDYIVKNDLRSVVLSRAIHYAIERQQILDRLQQSQILIEEQREFLRSVIDANPNFIFVKNLDGTFFLVNQALAQFYGCEPDQCIGKTENSFNVTAMQMQRYTEAEQAVIKTLQEKIIFQEPRRSVTGELRWFQTIRRPLFAPDGSVRQILGVTTDITERQQAEQILWQQAEREQLLGKVTNQIRQSLDLTQILVTAARRIRQFLGADCTLIYGLRAKRAAGVWQLQVSDGLDVLRLPLAADLLDSVSGDTAVLLDGSLEGGEVDGRSHPVPDQLMLPLLSEVVADLQSRVVYVTQSGEMAGAMAGGVMSAMGERVWAACLPITLPCRATSLVVMPIMWGESLETAGDDVLIPQSTDMDLLSTDMDAVESEPGMTFPGAAGAVSADAHPAEDSLGELVDHCPGQVDRDSEQPDARELRKHGSEDGAVDEVSAQSSEGGNLWGVMFAVYQSATAEREDWELNFLRQLADQLAIGIQQAQLYRRLKQANRQLAELATLDGLTGIANRRRFDEVLDREWRRLARQQEPLSLIVADIDSFKLYNDHYGHLAGDDCLRQVAKEIAFAAERSSDLAFRYGGEEFAVILPDTDREGAKVVGHRICQRVRSLRIPHETSQVSECVTISVGAASMVPSLALSPKTLLDTADRALFEAKSAGRNQVHAR